MTGHLTVVPAPSACIADAGSGCHLDVGSHGPREVHDHSTAPALTATPLIEQERDGSVTHEVHVTLSDVEWHQLVGDFAAAVVARLHREGILARIMAAGQRPCTAGQQEALDKLVEALKGPTHPGSQHSLPPTFTLTPEQAAGLSADLDLATDEPVVCPCGAVVQQPTQLTDTCGRCVDAIGGNR